MVPENDDDRTNIRPNLAPPPKAPGVQKPAPRQAETDSEETHVGSMPPPRPVQIPPGPGAPQETAASEESTRVGAGLPPTEPKPIGPSQGPAEAASPQPAPPPGALPQSPPMPSTRPSSDPGSRPGADVGEEETVIVSTKQPAAVARMQRLKPSGRSDLIALDRTTYMLGRSSNADIALFSPTAGRMHARLTKRGDAWYISSIEDHTVRLNGIEVPEETEIAHKTHVELGGDELLFLDGRAPAETPALELTGRIPGLWILLLLVLLLAAAVTAAGWFMSW